MSVRELAERQFGKPTKVTPTELRFGKKGSISVKLPDGVWYDYEKGVGGKLRLDDDRAPRRKTREEIEAEERNEATRRNQKRTKAWKFWSETKRAEGTLVETYLRSRGLPLPPGAATIRFHPAAYHHIAQKTMPAMCAAIQHVHTGRFLGVHRTFLEPDGRGKAKEADPARLVMGLQKDGAIMLHRPAPGGWHGFAEGIETALSGHLLEGLPVWALINAGNIMGFSGGRDITKALLFADRDAAGYRAAEGMARSFKGPFEAIAPMLPGHDWNDELKRMRCTIPAYEGADLFVPGCVQNVTVAKNKI
jgi:hypothetical protein